MTIPSAHHVITTQKTNDADSKQAPESSFSTHRERVPNWVQCRLSIDHQNDPPSRRFHSLSILSSLKKTRKHKKEDCVEILLVFDLYL
jgi:hypothetical protein